MSDPIKEKGFTLVEVTAVLVVLAIVAVVIISRMTSTADVNNKVMAETLKSHIRYAQLKAMNTDADAASGCNASFGISMSANSYFMFKDCNSASKVALPGAETDTVSLGASLSLSPANTVAFDRYGRPCSDLSCASGNLYTANQVITLGTETITITKNTGFIP
jgi:prepilin-type N-terminal cleavage/methylation domain-containing protein